MKLYILIALTFLTSCTSKHNGKAVKTDKKNQTTNKIDKNALTQPTEILEIFIDSLSIGEKGSCKIEIIKHRVLDENYFIVKFYTRNPKQWYLQNTYLYPCFAQMDLEPNISDFNNDGLNDITFNSGIAARGANEVRRLFVYDKQTKELISIVNAEQFPNLQYNAELNCIDAWLFHGGTTTVFARIEKDSLKEFASVDLDNYITVYEVNKFGQNKLIRRDTITSFRNRDAFVRYKNYKPLKEY